MTASANNNPPTVESLAENQQHIMDSLAGLVDVVTELVDGVTGLANGQQQLSARLDGTNKRLDNTNKRLDNTNKRLDNTNKRLDNTNKRLDDNNKRLDGVNNKLDGTNRKLDGLMDDIGLVKGGHARNETIRNASLIAHRLGYQFISELRQEALIGFAELAKANGVADNEAESFAKADLVMIAQDANNQPGYIAVEVSFTISDNDVRRAVRNAEYLHKYTGIRAHAAVAGVDILSDAKQQVDSGKVHWYEIPKREIQPT